MKLHALQLAIAETLNRDAFLAQHNVAVLAENKGDVIKTVEAEVARLGCCALVLTPHFKSAATDTLRPLGNATAVVQVFESPLLNRGKANRATALDAAERVACALHRRALPGVGVLVFESLAGNAAGGTLDYAVAFTIKLDLDGSDVSAGPDGSHPPKGTP